MTGRQCGCGCGGTDALTHRDVFNAPGRTALDYRVGRYGDFRAAMLARLSGFAYPALRDLTVRTPDDPAIALLDAWAVLGDLLTFHTERIASEGYLRTATEERSLELLGRLVGHRPRPGVAADTFLSYTLDRDTRSEKDPTVTIPRGARATSVPARPGQEPQSYETDEDLTARWSWNELAVRRRRPYQLTARRLRQRREIHVAGTGNNVRPGDQLLFVFSAEKSADRGQRLLLPAARVTLDRDSDTTVVALPGATLPSLEALLEELQKWITEGRGSPNPRPEGSPVIADFDEQVLAPLRADLDLLDTATKFADRLAETVERLREAKELAQGHADVADWFEDLDAKLVELQEQARELEPPQPDENGDRTPASGQRSASLYEGLGLARLPASGDSEDGDCTSDVFQPAVRGLGALLAALRTAPARPPASARHLPRDPQRIYAPGADQGARLLTALDPRLGDGLYTAWRQADFTAPLALREVQAMRVTATPFGATAPLKPVYDQTGTVVRHDDWPLTGSKLLSVRIGYAGAQTAPHQADFSYVEGGGSVQKSVPLPYHGPDFTFGPGKVDLHTREPEPGSEEEPGVTVRFLPELPRRTVVASYPGADGRIRVSLGDGTEPVDLGPGDEHETELDGMKVTLRRTDEGHATSVEVAFATQLQQTSRTVLALDAVYDGLAPGQWVAVHRPRKGVTGQVPGDPKLALVITRITGVRVLSRADFGITGKVTELTLEDPWLDDEDTLLSHIRDTSVFARGESLRIADEPLTEDVHGNELELADLHEGLVPGRWLVVTGERTDIPGTTGVRGTELAMIAGVEQRVDPTLPGDAVHTGLTLATDLAYRYRRDTVRVLGNVVPATQGATRDEAIGSGDASKTHQTFTLWQGPLTWLAADNPRGARSTLEVRVDGVLWHEVDSLAARGPTERVYVTGTAADGRVTVTFGDGVHGARLPTGQENVRARYRVGIGKDANVGAGRITQPVSRPLGVSAVTNPLPATGGSDPDGPGLARRTIPLAVTALDRLVSVPDYEDFARSRAGIGRAAARKLYDGTRETVHVTVAGVDDIPLAEDSDVVRTLHAALTEYGDASLAVDVALRELVLLVVVARVKVLPDYAWDLVEPAVRRALLARLGYPGRELGQPAYLSEVLAAAQSVPGVDYVDVDAFTGIPGDLTPAGLEHLAEHLTRPQPVVEARPARFAERRYRVERPDGETLTEVAARHGISIAEMLRLNPDITDTRRLPAGRSVVVFRGIRPAQFAILNPDLPDTLILQEVTQ